MNEIIVPLHESLTQSLTEVASQVGKFYAMLSDVEFVKRAANAWSPAENLDHLIKSNKPLARALTMTQGVLHRVLKTADKPSRTFQEVRAQYDAMLARGAVAAGSFLPAEPSSNAREHQQQLLEQWDKYSQELVRAVEAWRDGELDKYLIPHPLLGDLTVREMLFFTLYHNMRHISAGGD